jgi:hypothetical protein
VGSGHHDDDHFVLFSLYECCYLREDGAMAVGEQR